MIRVLQNYGGYNTNERRILPGEYDDNDPRLFGIGDYLVQHGHAVRVSLTTAPGGEVLVIEPDSQTAKVMQELRDEGYDFFDGLAAEAEEHGYRFGVKISPDETPAPEPDSEPEPKKGKRR